MAFVIKGKIPKNLSREEIRSITHACETIFRYHNLDTYKSQKITVQFTKKHLGKCEKAPESDAVGTGNYALSRIRISTPYIEECRDPYHSLLGLMAHEMIHVFIDFPHSKCEYPTSTLVAKFKNDVSRIANILVENTYQRAAFIAHTKISYKPKGKDHYNKKENHRNHETSRGKKYRRTMIA